MLLKCLDSVADVLFSWTRWTRHIYTDLSTVSPQVLR